MPVCVPAPQVLEQVPQESQAPAQFTGQAMTVQAWLLVAPALMAHALPPLVAVAVILYVTVRVPAPQVVEQVPGEP